VGIGAAIVVVGVLVLLGLRALVRSGSSATTAGGTTSSAATTTTTTDASGSSSELASPQGSAGGTPSASATATTAPPEPTAPATTAPPPSTLQGAPGPMVVPNVLGAEAVGCTRYAGGGVRATFHVVLQGGQNWALVAREGPVTPGPDGQWTVVVQDVSGPPNVRLASVLVGGGSPYRTQALPVGDQPVARCA
jgi:hypothetical protein